MENALAYQQVPTPRTLQGLSRFSHWAIVPAAAVNPADGRALAVFFSEGDARFAAFRFYTRHLDEEAGGDAEDRAARRHARRARGPRTFVRAGGFQPRHLEAVFRGDLGLTPADPSPALLHAAASASWLAD